jgi:hypothetical protein
MIALRKGQSKIGHEHYVDAISEVQAKKKVRHALRCGYFRYAHVLICSFRTRSTSMLKQYLTTAVQALEWCICKTNGIEVRQLGTPFTFTKHGVLAHSRLGLVHTESLLLSIAPCHHFFVVTKDATSRIFIVLDSSEASSTHTHKMCRGLRTRMLISPCL